MIKKLKILLLGEYSGVHTDLRDTLKKLGYQVDLSSNSDGFKKIGNSNVAFPLPPTKNLLIRIFRKLIFFLWNKKKYFGYDIVQLIDHDIFGSSYIGYNYAVLKKIKKHSRKIFLLSVGSSYYYYKLIENLRYHPLIDHIELDGIDERIFKKRSNQLNNYKVAQLVDGIIPSTYSYRLAYKNFVNLKDTIPFPVNLEKIKLTEQIFIDGKVTILHGLLRPGFKGTKFIIPAMEKLKKKYPDKVEIIIDGKMPFENYKKILSEVNILVDQALSYEYGMNALYAMAMGKVVLSGNEPESREDIGREDIPVINILPNEDDIYSKLEKLILNKDQIIKTGRESRKFVEEVHDSVLIAKKYLEAWGINHE